VPIGVFDSGIGGLTILRALVARLPGEDFVYLGDNAHAPYGSKPPEQVFRLTCDGVTRLFDEGCGLVILACNTASAVSLREIQQRWLDPADHRVLGVFVPVIEHLTRRDWGDQSPPTHTGLSTVALFATPATVASGAFPRELHFRARDVRVEAQACTALVDAIERGDWARAEALVAAHVTSLLERLPAPQAAVLGCTHYPLVEAAFRRALPEGTALVTQPEVVAESLADYLVRHRRFSGGAGSVRYLTTGDPAAVGACAARFLGVRAVFELPAEPGTSASSAGGG
jgi:glutamate racemase